MVKVLHIKSNVVTDNKPKLPSKDQIEYGEIAVNYAADHETISLKNSNDDIKTFSSDEYYTKQKLGTAFTDSTVTDVLNNVHETLAASINSLNDKKADRESIGNLNDALQKKVSIDDFKTYSAATNTKINGKANTKHTHTLSEITDYKAYDDKEIRSEISKKQNQLTAGTGIKIENNTISTTLDTTIFRFADALPTENIELNKLYFVPSTTKGEQNIYTEYAYHDNAWEILGQYKADVDLTLYAKTTDVDTKLADSEQVIAGGISELKNKVDAATATTYTKTDVDNKLAAKLDTSAYTKVNTSDFATAANTYTKKEVDDKIPTLPKFRTINGRAITGDTTNITIEAGTSSTPYDDTDIKADIDKLKTGKLDKTTYDTDKDTFATKLSNAGKVDDVQVDGTSVVTGKVANIDLSLYAKTSDVNNELKNKLNVADFNSYSGNVNTKISAKQDKGDSYTKTESDGRYLTKTAYTTDKDTLTNKLADYAKTSDVTAALNKKQDVLTIDDKLDKTSANAVQNKAIATELQNLMEAISGVLNDINDRLNTLSNTVAKQIKNSTE